MANQQQLKDAREAGLKAAKEGRPLSSCLTYTGKSAKPDIKAAFMKGYLEGMKNAKN